MRRTFAIAIATALCGLLACSAGAFAAKPDDPGGGKGGGNKPPTPEEGAGNNLSFPGILTDTDVGSITASWSPPTDPGLGTHYSYGCATAQSMDEFSYPNTSCVDDLAHPTVYYDADQCVEADAPCKGFAVSRIFWQKVAENDWWADQDNIGDLADVAYVDWGDALEARSWTSKSQIRVETQPYSSTIPGFNPTSSTCKDAAASPETDCKVGFQMWHVSGQGTTEQWGVRADDSNVSYNYDSPFQIIVTDAARLNIAKMEPGSAECPQPGGGDEEGEVVILQSDPPPLGAWTGSGWDGACTWRDQAYTWELSVGGKYVYGYNWPMKTVALEPCGPEWVRTGWWRLTFYTTGDLAAPVQFSDPPAPVHAPPDVPAAVRTVPREAEDFITSLSPEPEESSEVLYTPVVDTSNNLTYIDLCIVEGGGGGGGGGKPPK